MGKDKKGGCSGCFTWLLAAVLVFFVVTVMDRSDTPKDSTAATMETVLPGSVREAVMNGELELADIKHRADALGWSTDAWQGWYYIASQTGTKMEAIEEAAKNINQKLAAEDAEFLLALAELGISKDEAKAMKPEELFEKVIYGLQAIED